MATSQFTIYTSNDPGGPGLITGTTGSLLSVLDACLVNGYINKPSAGWTKPFPNLSSSLGCYKQISGSRLTLFISDGAPSGTAGAKEAWACGFEVLTSLTGSTGTGKIFTGSYANGFGYGQFPQPSQLLTSGHVVWRKSTSADTVGRSWIIAADASTMYLWISTGDFSGFYYHGSFGDFYSLAGPSDLWRCQIYGRVTENIASGAGNDWTDGIATWAGSSTNTLSSGQPGHYIDRTYGGTGTSIQYVKKGDSSAAGVIINSAPVYCAIGGTLQTPNSTDNSLYLSPLWVVEPTAPLIRGRLRGINQICHPYTNFSDGQIIQGSGDYAGKTFCIIRLGINNGYWALETSPTVETN